VGSTQVAGEGGVPFLFPGGTSIAGLFLANPSGLNVSPLKMGMASAVLAASAMPRGPRQSKGYTVSVNSEICRGCGRCYLICPYQAISFQENSENGCFAVVDEALCKGCGNCISVCPSNAADSPYRNQAMLEKTIEEMLR
jgi:heterodisulfide reductase subunit A-like polyferredoxin